MALIEDFPDFAASAAPSADDLATAARKFCEQIGGVDSEGQVYPGNIGIENLGGNAQFRSEQKEEPYSELGASLNATDRLGPLSCEVILVGLTLVLCEKHAGELTLRLNGRDFLVLSFDDTLVVKDWPMSYSLAAGIVAQVLVTFPDPQPTTPHYVTARFKSMHQG